MEIIFDLLTKDEIEVRIGTGKFNQEGKLEGKGISLLLYKTARVDANALDKKIGQFNWQKRYYECKGNLFCEIGIYDQEKKEWIWKGDCGTESNTEAEKGEASDAMKRAGFQWGIGRELYSSPFIWANAETVKNNDIKKESKFVVEEIEYNENRTIKHVVISHKGVVVFTNKKGTPTKAITKPTTEPEGEQLRKELLDECRLLNIELINIARYFKKDIVDLTNTDIQIAIQMKKKAKEKK